MKYPSDVTDEQWAMIEGYFDVGNYGKSRKHPQRLLVNAVFYVIKTGCQWRYLPKDYPPWKSVYSFYMRANHRGLWEEIMKMLVAKDRMAKGRNAQPSYGLIDRRAS
ncbi:MAG: transposase, partial [Scytonema sp. CRU_2_7]|nr:transposase [Scytonema sp. CRU_2_7]